MGIIKNTKFGLGQISVFTIIFLSLLSISSFAERGSLSSGSGNSSVHCISDIKKLVSGLRPSSHFDTTYSQGKILIHRMAPGDLREKKSLNLMSFNTFNLFENIGSHKGIEEGVQVELKVTPKEASMPIRQAAIVKEIDADIAFLQEVESYKALETFANDYLDEAYEPLMIRNNDMRGIQLGLLVRKGLGIDIEIHSFKNLRNGEMSAFTRDAQVVVVKDQKTDRPIMNIVHLHLKSMRDRKGDPNSFRRRKGEVDSLKAVFRAMRKRQGGDIPTTIAGDLNNEFANSEYDYLRNLGFSDIFDLSGFPNIPQRATHIYFPPEGGIVENQLDHFLVDGLIDQGGVIEERGIYRYLDQEGSEIPLPRTKEERKKLPSDHYPIWMRMTVENLLNFLN